MTRGADRAGVVWLVACLAATGACAMHTAEPELVSDERAPADTAVERQPRDYAAMLRIIGERFEREYSLPRVDVELRLYTTRQQFQQGLIESGYTRALARQASSFHAIGGARTVMVNQSQIAQFPWEQQVRLLAHELAHSVQYRLAGGVRGASEQWLREGFADYLSCRITASMGFGRVEHQRDALLAPLERVPVGTRHVPLGHLRTFTQWVGAQPRYDVPVYTQAFVAAEKLIDDKGIAAALRYFELSRPSTDPEANFVEAFGITLAQFESSFAPYWLRLLTQRGQRESE